MDKVSLPDRVPLSEAQDGPKTHAEKEATEVVHDGAWIEGMSYLDDIDYHKMAGVFDISLQERQDPRVAEKLSFLTDWAKRKTGSEDSTTQMLEVKNLGKQLGLTYRGYDLIKRLYQYARLDENKQQIEKEMELVI